MLGKKGSCFLLGLVLVQGSFAGEPGGNRPGPTRGDEPVAKGVSLQQAGAYLDAVAGDWTRRHQCGTCHTNVPYLMARPLMKEAPSAEEKAVRQFFEQRVANWDRGGKGDKPRWDTEVVTTAVALALHDAGSSGKLHPSTRAALDRMWKVQRENGSWDWLKCNWPPMEHDDFYGAALAAVGVAMAPEKYAQGDSSKEGIARLRKYLASTPAPSLHHQAHLLWASSKLDGLLTREQQKQTIKDLLDKQRADGGWSLASLGDWKGYDGRDNDPNAPSDGYGTGLVVLVLRQAGLPVDHPAIARGSRWLRENQRVSGRWYTRSLNKDAAHFITNAGTAFAVMALKACDS